MRSIREQQEHLFRRAENRRALGLGLLQRTLAGGGITLLIAIQIFDAEVWQRKVLASVFHGGLLLSPLILTLVARRRLIPARMMAAAYLILAIGLAVAAWAPNATTFTLSIAAAVPILNAVSPLVTASWQRFVPTSHRGRSFGRMSLVMSASGLATSLVLAMYLESVSLADCWRGIVVLMSAAAFWVSAATWHQPPFRLPQAGPNPLGCLRHLWQHPLFGYCSAAWMLIGFANLATIPLRVDWLADDQHGLNYDAGTVLWLTLIVPGICSMMSAPIWGRLYDHINFIIMRILVNMCFMISIACFFEASLIMQIIGAITFGLGVGGGNVAWNLWVTSFAPGHLVSEYQSCHTFLTGLRGVLGPTLAYAMIADWSIRTASWFAVAMILLSILLFAVIIPYGRRQGNSSKLIRSRD